MTKNIVQNKSYALAIEVVSICRILQQKHEYVLSKQLLKSGTSVGANIQESAYAQSRADFISKMSISLKEAKESEYWVRLLIDTQFLSEAQTVELRRVLQDVIALLVSILKTARQNS